MTTGQLPGEPFYQPIADLYLPDRVAHNVDILTRARTAIALFSGTAAGLLGLTGLFGLVLYLCVAVVGDMFLQKIATAGEAAKFLPAANRDFFSFGSLATGALSFIMAWLIFYNVLFVF